MTTRNFALKLPKLFQPFPKVSLCFFQTKGKRKRNKKNKKKQSKRGERFSGFNSRELSLQRHFGPKKRENDKEFEGTANLFLPQTIKGIAGSLKC